MIPREINVDWEKARTPKKARNQPDMMTLSVASCARTFERSSTNRQLQSISLQICSFDRAASLGKSKASSRVRVR